MLEIECIDYSLIFCQNTDGIFGVSGESENGISMKRHLMSVHADLRIGPTTSKPILNMTIKIRLNLTPKIIPEFQELAKWDLFSDTYTATGPFSRGCGKS